MFWPSMTISPVTRHPSMVSFMRLRQRMKVDLPQPDGPMMAVTRLGLKPMLILFSARLEP